MCVHFYNPSGLNFATRSSSSTYPAARARGLIGSPARRASFSSLLSFRRPRERVSRVTNYTRKPIARRRARAEVKKRRRGAKINLSLTVPFVPLLSHRGYLYIYIYMCVCVYIRIAHNPRDSFRWCAPIYIYAIYASRQDDFLDILSLSRLSPYLTGFLHFLAASRRGLIHDANSTSLRIKRERGDEPLKRRDRAHRSAEF